MKEIASPLPGVFYRRPDPEKPVYVEEGHEVKAGDTIGLIEVMKSFQEVKAEDDGVIKSIKVEDGAVVEAGQVVAELE
ncbi:biotin carboxyl carrier domain-containing protein [Halobacillus sp. A1]|uniref:acetyl-CoA carboxylase n=1 Tax=Halobacillus sp. A1 TaxID=2880262 RepID=UPI0020A68383|nr:acetyl-CoA carboxylase [Halobacillus sp. A1]MCP3029804.1 biotin carboxyl carrier domain-containing protein [Halobacillus sp. A1]